MTEVIYSEVSVAKKVIRLSEEATKRRDRLLAENRCLGCERKFRDKEIKRCGQCHCCYQAVLRKEEDDPKIREQLIREGKMLNPSEGGRKPASKFTQELAQR